MRNIETRLAKLEHEVEAYATHSNCRECGPNTLHMLWREDDGRLHDDRTDLYWPTDTDGNALCPHCGHHPANPVIVICSMPERQPSRPGSG